MADPRTRPITPSRSQRGYRRLRALLRLAVPERPVQVQRAVEPCARRGPDGRVRTAASPATPTGG
jgi:hypothetical protein